MSKTNKKTNNFSQYHSLSIFQTDSFYLKSSYNKKNNYFNKYYYGNSNDKHGNSNDTMWNKNAKYGRKYFNNKTKHILLIFR